MDFKRYLLMVFPAPRGRVRWVEVLPLAIFLMVFALIILGVQYLDLGVVTRPLARLWNSVTGNEVVLPTGVLFTRPMAFWWILTTVWVWWMFRNGFHGLPRMRAMLSLMVRLCLLATFVTLMADPRALRTTDSLSVVYVMDVSNSIGHEAENKALDFVASTVADKPEKDEAGLVLFGDNASVELPPNNAFPLEGGKIIVNSKVDRNATNVAQALSLAAAMIPEDARGRIVLISDGSATAGNMEDAVESLQKRDIPVDVLPIDYAYKEESWVERIELPQTVKIGENYKATVIVSSLQKGKGKLKITENGQEVGESVEVEFNEGKNRFDVPLYLRNPGYYEYTASLEVPDGEDHITENNQAVNYLFIQGEGKVLLVHDSAGEARDWQFLEKAIREGERAVEKMDPFDFPRDSLLLMPYDCVIFCNVPQDSFDAAQLQAIHDSVYNQGTGFLMVGGANSFGPGGYHRTVIEDALPVSMDITKKKILPKGALVLILHSCEFPEGNTWAKRITKQAIKVLGAQDEVGVIDYESGEQWVFELAPAGDYDKMVPKINAASPGDMPAFAPTMQLALDALTDDKCDAATKHMIIISDGDPQPPPPDMVKKFIEAEISVSMVAIFPHGGQEISVMRGVAEATKGRYYFPSDPNELPSIFIKEAKTLKRSMIQNGDISVVKGAHSSPVMDGINAAPILGGYVLTSLKETGAPLDVLFTVPKDAEEGERDPVLATWRYGLGSTAAFTSDLGGNWGQNWLEWDKYRAFVKQLLIKISRVQKAGHLRMWAYASGNDGVLMVEDFHPEEQFLDVAAQVAGPNDRSITVPLKQVGPRRYQATFSQWGPGRYQITTLGKSAEREDRVFGGFIVSYSAEYLKFSANMNQLRRVQEDTKGNMLGLETKGESLFPKGDPKQTTKPIFDWFLIALACLVPLDVGLRRVQIDIATIKAWLGLGKRAETTQMMNALLAKKLEVGATLKGGKVERPMPGALPKPSYSPQSSGQRTAAAPTSRPKEAPPKPAADSTTSRLLDLKKKRDQEPKD